MATAGSPPRTSHLSSPKPAIDLARKTYFDRDVATFSYEPGRLGVEPSGGRLYIVDIYGQVALELDLPGQPAHSNGDAALSIPLEKLMPGRYFLVAESGRHTKAQTVGELHVLIDARDDRLSSKTYIHSPLPLSNHLGDIDRALDSYRAGHHNSLMRTSWARETSTAQIDDDYRLLPHHLLHADHLGLKEMTADMEFPTVGAPPEGRNPRVARKGTMEYAVTEEGVAQREVAEEGLSEEEFQIRRQRGDFLECFEVFGCGHWYGTLRDEVLTGLRAGKWVVLEIDVQGALAVMQNYPEAISIFVRPKSLEEIESLEELERRLRGRGTESEEAIQRRLAQAEKELTRADRYRYQVVNDQLQRAVREICHILDQEAEKHV